MVRRSAARDSKEAEKHSTSFGDASRAITDSSPTVEPLVKFLLGRQKGIKTGHAKEVGRRAVDYIRGSDLVKWVKENREECKRLAGAALAGMADDPENSTEAEDARIVGSLLLDNGYVCKASWVPPDNKTVKRPKWPQKLTACRDQNFDENQFYVLLYEGDTSWRNILLVVILLSVLTVVMWPAWPQTAKQVMWVVVFAFLMSIWVLVLIRLAVFVLLWFFGIDLWIMPNLFNDDVPFLDIFRPWYTWHNRGDGYEMLAVRFVCALLLTGFLYQLNQTHSLSDIYGFANQQFLDVYEWGQKKISDEPADPRKAYPSVEEFEDNEN